MQGCEKIECVREKVNYYKENVLRRGWQNGQKEGLLGDKLTTVSTRRQENEAAYRDAALFSGRFILLRFAVDHVAQHRDQH